MISFDFKPYFKIIVMAAVIFLLGKILIERSCKPGYETKEYLELKGQLERHKAQIQEEQEIKNKAFQEAQKLVMDLKKRNEKLEKEKKEALEKQTIINEDLRLADQKLQDLRKKEKELKDSKDIIENLRAQNRELERKFSLAISDTQEEKKARAAAEAQIQNLNLEISKKDFVIASLEDSIRKRDKIIKQFEGLVEKGERGSFWSKAESIVVYGFAVYGALDAGSKVFK